MPKFPELEYRRVKSLLKHFEVRIVKMKGSKHACVTKGGAKFTFDLHSSEVAWPELVHEIVKRMGSSEEDFWTWYHKT